MVLLTIMMVLLDLQSGTIECNDGTTVDLQSGTTECNNGTTDHNNGTT